MNKIQGSRVNPTMFANNWDRLGGRVLDILNSYILSKKLDCEFIFYWPLDDRFPEMEEQINFFSQNFIQQHRVHFDPQEFNFEFIDFSKFTQESAKRYINDQKENMYFKKILKTMPI